MLLWRATPVECYDLSVYAPQLLDDYLSIVISTSGRVGIYDDTPDLNRALAISDAYYGDWSSLVALYMYGKPVMIQDVDVVPKM